MITEQPRIKEHWAPTGKRENVQDYYTVRAGAGDCADYWQPKADPDGVVRDRTTIQERSQFIADHQYITDFVNQQLPKRVVDIGAGLGLMLAGIVAESKTAVEVSGDALDVLWHSYSCEEIWQDVAQLPSGKFDVAILHHVIEHLIDPIYMISHIRRILYKDGWLVIGTPDFGSPCAKRFGDKFRLLHDPTHISLFTLESMSRFLRDHGFTIRETLFPFPERYATAENFARWNDTSKISPPWPGNVFTMFCTRD